MTPNQRSEADQHRLALTDAILPPEGNDLDLMAVLGKMLLSYPIVGASKATGEARTEAYLDALDDLPAWVVAQSVKKWHRGECGSDHNYTFAPAPAVLRKVASRALDDLRAEKAKLDALLNATSFEEARAGSTALVKV